MKILSGVLWFFALLIPLILLGGWMMELYWNWFLSPVSEGIPNVTFPVAVGLSTFVAYLKFDSNGLVNNDDTTIIILKLAAGTGAILWFLVFGYILHSIIS